MPAAAVNRRRKVGVALLSAAAAVVTATLLGMRPNWIREEWYIHQLQSDASEQRIQAAEKLGEMRATRAVPAILEAMRAQWIRRREKIDHWVGSPESLWGDEGKKLSGAIVRMGKPATLELVRATRKLGGTNDFVCMLMPELILVEIYSADLRLLKESHTGSGTILDDLFVRLRDTPTLSPELRAAAGEAIARRASSDR
jgi:hypothetical protein